VHEPSSLAVGSALKLLCGTKVIYDRHEYYPRLIREKIESKGFKTLAGIVEYIETVSEKFMMENIADRVIVVDEEMGNQIKHNQIIHNYPTGYTRKVRSGCNFGYVGIMNLRKIPESVEIVRKLSEYVPEVRYKIAGMAFDKKDIPENCEHVTYHSIIPHCEVNKFLDEVSWGFCLYEKTERYETARSTKTFEYIMSGIPVIASRTAGNQFIEDNNYGILIDPDNIEESVKAIREAIPKCEEYSRNCLNAKFGWEEDKLLKLYKSLESEK
jgi:glycosyltransferase involved in cell wall biosynthesis